ncbi:oligosaccharide flippase family protein [Paraglaciecola sp.]|uniref:lipopolysaccharide biosynthesis protein n=1 Tax=Paraglaciecola sp. TaxID=1920173 RepID=UPI0030F43CAD
MKLSQILAFALGPIASAALGLLTVPLMAWTFEPAVIGKIAMLNTFLAGCALVLTLGLDQAYVREYHETQNKAQLLGSLVLPSLLVTSIFSILILIFHEFIALTLFAETTHTLYIAGLLSAAVFISILFRFTSLILRMKEYGFKFSMIQISPKLTLLTLILALLASDKLGGFYIAFSFSIVAMLVSVLLAIALTMKEWRLASSSHIDHNMLIKALKFGSPLIISGFAYWGLISVDKLVIRYYSGMSQLGLYSIAFSFAAVMAIFQSIFSTIWAPIVYRWHKENIKIEQFSLITDWIVMTLSCVFFIVIFLSPLLCYLLPESYDSIINLIPACMLFPVFYTISETTVVGMNIARKTSYSILVTLLPLAVNILLSIWLVPQFGAGGAAVSVALAFFLYLILRTEISRFLWRKFPVYKLYMVSLLLIINAAWPALTQESLPWWVSVSSLALVSIIYKIRYLNIRTDFRKLQNA